MSVASKVYVNEPRFDLLLIGRMKMTPMKIVTPYITRGLSQALCLEEESVLVCGSGYQSLTIILIL